VGQLQLTGSASRSVRFLLLRQKFYELLEARGAAEAMACLREQIAPLEKEGTTLLNEAGTQMGSAVGDVHSCRARGVDAADQGGEAAPSLSRTVHELR
jgi:hypothetical protein